MRISAKGDYATRAVLDLAINHKAGGVSRIHAIAERQHIPVKYLENILLLLNRAGVVRSRRGNQGGYYLARPPESITVGEVIRIVDGPLAPISCASTTAYEECPEEAACGLRSVWLEARNALAKVLDNTTFADVLKRTKKISLDNLAKV
ncbi:MAG: Rrf2 family transcriptional regulator [Actinomycetota bacterium]|nr:Rrf2 family transcriptional regulator [Actinomycetota bacterium]